MTKRIDGAGVSDLSLYDMERRSSMETRFEKETLKGD
jgi:hypothetical protein